MNSAKDPGRVFKRITAASLFLTIGISVSSLLGWLSGLLIVASISPDFIPVAPSTAICFSLLSAPLLISTYHPANSLCRSAVVAGACLAMLISTMVLIGFFRGMPFEAELPGLEQPSSTPGAAPPGHMSPITAVTFLAASLAVLSLAVSREGRRGLERTAALIATGVFAVGSVVVLGYLHGTPFWYGGTVIPMALPTALAFALFGLGMIAASGPAVAPVSFFAGPTVRSRLMRAFFPTVVSAVLVDGLLFKTTYTSMRNPALISASVALLSIIVVGVIVTKLSKTIGDELDRAHAERDRAEGEREKLITELGHALAEVRQLSGLLPICMSCKKIRDDKGGWNVLESYISERSEVEFSHGLCPDCARKAYEEIKKGKK